MSSDRAWTTVRRLVFGAVSSGLVVLAASAEAGTLDASWTAPTTNTDGSPLTDLSSYLVYYGTSSSPCPGSTSVAVASPTTTPEASQQVSVRLSGLATGTAYNVSVTAVDAAGNQSTCSGVASAVARADFAVSPSGTVSFGSVNVGSSADRTFTVSNTAGGVLSGSVSLGAPAGSGANPFAIVAGNPISLSGAGATQNVTVRFTPSTTTTMSTNLIFAVSGGTVSAIVTGTGAGTDTTRPTVMITSPTSGDTHTTGASSLSLAGTAADNIGVTQVSWANSRGGSGTVTGTANWTASNIPLQTGSNVITVTVRDAAGNSGTDALTVTVTDTAAPSITITAPTGNPTFSMSGSASSSSLSLAGTASDNVGIAQVSWTNNRGGTGTATGTTSWSAAGIPLQTGSNVITVTARDAAGNTAVDTLTVTYSAVVADTTPPSVTITPPTATAVSTASASSLTLQGTASDNVGVTQVAWTNNLGGSGTATGTTGWSASGITLQTGTNVITVTARDAAGNLGSASVTVTQGDTDQRAPGISNVLVSDVTTTGARIIWTTDEASTSQVEYGRKFYRNRTPLDPDPTLVTSHSQVLSGLAPSTWYHFRVQSRDAAGNLGVSSDFYFETAGRSKR